MQRRSTIASFVLAAVLLSTGSACKEDETRPPPAADNDRQPGLGTGGAGGIDASAAADDAGVLVDGSAQCNDLVADGPAADQLAVIGDPPVGGGGTIASGTYVLSDARIYGAVGGGPTGLTYRGALRVDTLTSTLDRLITVSGQNGQPQETRDSGTFVASGTNVAASFSCPGVASEQLTYTASDTTLVLTNIVSRQSFTFTRR